VNRLVKIARENTIKSKKDTIRYKVSEIKFSGLLFNDKGTRPDPDRVKAINELKNPVNKIELPRILGMVNYLKNFVPSMPKVLSPLRQLLEKEKVWKWNQTPIPSVERSKKFNL